jgi:hypothetical protein
VLLTRDGKTQVAYHIRSNIIDVPKMPSFREWQAEETANYPADKWLQFEYPRTWYLVSDDGTIRKSHNPDGKVLVNFAVTNNTKVKASGALEKIVGNQLKLAQERDLYCHTFTPMNEHGPISSPILTAEETEEYLLKTFKGEVISPTGIHTYFMAKNAFGKKAKREGEDDPEILTFRRSRIPLIFELARLKRDAGYACCVTAYNGPGLEVEPGWHIRYISPRGA